MLQIVAVIYKTNLDDYLYLMNTFIKYNPQLLFLSF